MLSSCRLSVVFVLSSCFLPVVFMLSLCYLHVFFALSSCCLPVVFLLPLCSHGVVFALSFHCHSKKYTRHHPNHPWSLVITVCRPIAMLGAVCVAGLQMLTEVSDLGKHIFVEIVKITVHSKTIHFHFQ